MRELRQDFEQQVNVIEINWASRQGRDGSSERILLQPKNSKEWLKSVTPQAQRDLNAAGAYIANLLGGSYYGRKTPKADERLDKKALRYGNNFAFIRDAGSGTVALPTAQIRHALDMFCGDNDSARQIRADLKKFGVLLIGERENNFSNPGPSDMRNLNLKLAFAVTAPDGQKSYTAVELQFIDAKSIPHYIKSHAHFETLREAKTEYQCSMAKVEKAKFDLENNPNLTPRVYKTLQTVIAHQTAHAAEQLVIIDESRAARQAANQMAVKATCTPENPDGIDMYKGYKPYIDPVAVDAGLQSNKSLHLTA